MRRRREGGGGGGGGGGAVGGGVGGGLVPYQDENILLGKTLQECNFLSFLPPPFLSFLINFVFFIVAIIEASLEEKKKEKLQVERQKKLKEIISIRNDILSTLTNVFFFFFF